MSRIISALVFHVRRTSMLTLFVSMLTVGIYTDSLFMMLAAGAAAMQVADEIMDWWFNRNRKRSQGTTFYFNFTPRSWISERSHEGFDWSEDWQWSE